MNNFENIKHISNKESLISNKILFDISSNKLFNERIKAGSKNHITNYINTPFEIYLKLNGITKQVNILPLSYYILLSGLKDIDNINLMGYINILLTDFSRNGYSANFSLSLGELSPINALRINYKLGGNSFGILMLSPGFNEIYREKIVGNQVNLYLNSYDPELIQFEKKFKIFDLKKSKVRNVQMNPLFNLSSASAGGGEIIEMNLKSIYYNFIKQKKKIYEIRVFDEKRQKLKLLDTIKFINSEDTKKSFKVKIIELSYFKNFKEAIEASGVRKVLPNAKSLNDVVKIYESFPSYKENAKKYGVLRIKLL